MALEKPESLYDLVAAVEQCFTTRISIEPLPEHCAGAKETEAPPKPFSIEAGENFNDVVARLEAASRRRWIFDEIHGVPLFRSNPQAEGCETLLDTVITTNIEANSAWEALCALARAVNSANGAQDGRKRPLLIYFAGPAVLRRPPAILIEDRPVSLSVSQATAREALCSMFSQLGINGHYLYNCVAGGKPSDRDSVSINVFGEDGRVVDGGRIGEEEYKTLMETVDWMSEDDVLKVQSPRAEDGGGENPRK